MNPESANLPLWVIMLSMAMMTTAFLLTMIRVLIGPGLVDRIAALDLMAMLVLGFTALFAVYTDSLHYLDILVAAVLVLFIGTVGYALYLNRKYHD